MSAIADSFIADASVLVPLPGMQAGHRRGRWLHGADDPGRDFISVGNSLKGEVVGEWTAA